MTKIKLTRLKERKADIKYNKKSTVLAGFRSKNEIKAIDYGNTKIICPCTYSQKSINREFLEIKLRFRDVCNEGVSCNIPGDPEVPGVLKC